MNMNNKTEEKPIVRLPPSPTGNLHVGTARTALFNFLFARKHGGKMVFRLEDTDKERSRKEYEENITESLLWLGISYDEGPYRQSERGVVYQKHLERLVESGAAYVSKETPEKEGARTEVIRFKNSGRKITFYDIVRGNIEFDTTELGDFVIAKDFDAPLYHFAVVVDDYEMGVTHVIRGEDHISNTPRQILIQEALGAPRPEYAHIPLILAPDRTKLSKRHGAVSVIEYRREGYLPQALINYLALLGWNPGGEQEIFSLNELVEKFDLEKIQKGGAIFDVEKLKWFNREYLAKLSAGEREEGIRAFIPESLTELPGWSEEVFRRAVPVIFERIHVFGDVAKLYEQGELQYFFSDPEIKKEKISPLKLEQTEEIATKTRERIKHVISLLSNIPDDSKSFTAEAVKNTVWEYAGEEGRGNVLWPMRYALTGREKSPDPFIVAAVVGKDAALRRLEHAAAILS